MLFVSKIVFTFALFATPLLIVWLSSYKHRATQ